MTSFPGQGKFIISEHTEVQGIDINVSKLNNDFSSRIFPECLTKGKSPGRPEPIRKLTRITLLW